jgi:hypothetical protein
MPASEALPASKRAIVGGFLLAGSLSLGLLALLALPPRTSPSEWQGFRPLLVETSVPEAEVLASLGEVGIKELLCASTEPVLVSDWDGLETLVYAEAKVRLVQGDPRLDPYLQRLGLWFEARVGRVAYRVFYIKEAASLDSGAALDGQIEKGLSAFKGRYLVPTASDAGSGRGWLPFACSALLIILACAAGPLLGRKISFASGMLSRWLPARTIDRVAFRISLAAPWIALAWGGLSPAVLSALWALAIAEAADALDLPLEEFRRGEGARFAFKALGLQRLPSLALLAVALLASVADPSILPSIGLALLGSLAAAPAYALLSFSDTARRRFIPMAIGGRGALSRRRVRAAGNARALFACAIVAAWVIYRLLAPSLAPSEPSNIAFPRPESVRGKLRPLPPEARQRAPYENGEILPGLASYLEHRAIQEALPYVRLGEGRSDPFAAAHLPAPAGGVATAQGIEFSEGWAQAAYSSVPPLSIEGMLLRQGEPTIGRLRQGASRNGRPLAPIESLLYIFLLVPPIGRIILGAPFAKGAISGEQRQEA